jgi:hypothetical protein
MALNGRPARNNGSDVSAYPKRNARPTARAIEPASPQSSAVAIVIPTTSPMRQPVRQWFVALAASRLRFD